MGKYSLLFIVFISSLLFSDDTENLKFLMEKNEQLMSYALIYQDEFFKTLNPSYTEESEYIQILSDTNSDIRDYLGVLTDFYIIKIRISGEANKYVVQEFIDFKLKMLNQFADSKLEAIYISLGHIKSDKVRKLAENTKDILFEIIEFDF